jgi:hypothetical protein
MQQQPQQTNISKTSVNSSKTNVFQPVRNAIKLVSNAATVLSCRELLIIFINWTLKNLEIQQEQQRIKNKLFQKHFSIMQLNCETEFEFLQLLDVLYYTDNSFKYKLFIKNLIYGLISTDLSSESNEESTNQTESSSSSIVSPKTSNIIYNSKILSRISMMACDFMLPGFKLLKKVNWSSEMDSECDAGKLKNKTNTTILTEENINFSSSHSLKQAVDIENGINLTSKPNEIEKISTNDSTLLVVFDLSNKSHQSQNSNNNNNHATVTNMTMSNPRIRKTKLNSFLKQTTNTETQNDKQNVVLSKYFNNDNFETVKSDSIKMPDTFDKEENNDNNYDDDDDNESVDSLNYVNYLNDKTCTNKNANANSNGDSKARKKLVYDDLKKEAGEEVTDVEDDDDDEKEWQDLKKSSLKKKSKENSGKFNCGWDYSLMGQIFDYDREFRDGLTSLPEFS